MAAPRKQSPESEVVAPEAASAPGAAPEPEQEPAPAPEPAPEPETESGPAKAAGHVLTDTGWEIDPDEPQAVPERQAPPEPIHTYKLARPEPFRAGGHVLTERGWVLDTDQEK